MVFSQVSATTVTMDLAAEWAEVSVESLVAGSVVREGSVESSVEGSVEREVLEDTTALVVNSAVV